MNETGGSRVRPKFDPTLTLGHVLTAATMVAGIAGAWASLDKRVSLLEQRQDNQERQLRDMIERVDKNVDEIKSDLKQLMRRS